MQQASYTFDSNGNLTSKSEGTAKWYYSYDRENRLTNARKFGGLMPRANESVNYQYDAFGRRVVRQDKKTGRTEFTHDGMDVIQDRFEKNDGSTSTTNYINGIGIDDKLKVTSGTTSRYFLQDHLGSTVGMADTNGNITESATYDSFGRIQSSNLTTRYGYTGRETDSTTGLLYYRARQYDPQIGRFTSEDPIGFEGGDINLYGYVSNDPLSYNDPLGLTPDGNKKLAKCYADALRAYRYGKSQHSWLTWGAKKASPFASTGTIVSATRSGVDALLQPSKHTATWGNTIVTVIRPRSWSIKSAISNSIRGGLRTTGTAAARLVGIAAIGGTLVVEGADQAFGTEAFLRQAIAECNTGNSCASNKVESGVLTVIGGFFGFGFSDRVQKYIDNNE